MGDNSVTINGLNFIVSDATQAGAALRVFDQFKLARLHLQGIHLLLRIDLSRVEEKLVCRDISHQ